MGAALTISLPGALMLSDEGFAGRTHSTAAVRLHARKWRSASDTMNLRLDVEESSSELSDDALAECFDVDGYEEG